MSDSKFYQCFWEDVKEKLRLMRELDPELNVVYGAQCHKYETQPVVSDGELLSFEKKNQFVLPVCYRTYLQFFGGCGASEFNGTLSFRDIVSRSDVSKPSTFSVPDNVRFYSDGEYPENKDGQVEITHGFNPSSAYLFLNGSSAGRVYWSDSWSMAGGLGTFHEWYMNWSTNVLGRLHLHKRVIEFPPGSHITELENAFPELVNTFQYTECGPTHARVGAATSLFELDSLNNLIALEVCGNVSDDSLQARIDY